MFPLYESGSRQCFISESLPCGTPNPPLRPDDCRSDSADLEQAINATDVSLSITGYEHSRGFYALDKVKSDTPPPFPQVHCTPIAMSLICKKKIFYVEKTPIRLGVKVCQLLWYGLVFECMYVILILIGIILMKLHLHYPKSLICKEFVISLFISNACLAINYMYLEFIRLLDMHLKRIHVQAHFMKTGLHCV